MSKKSARRIYKVSTGKLLSKKIDTALERRMQEIAKKEVQSSIVRLIDRRYWFGNCDREHNQFEAGTAVFYDGVVQQLCRINKQDVNFVVNAPQVADANEDPSNPEVDNDGAQQGMVTSTAHGKRRADVIHIDGMSVSLKAFYERSAPFAGQDLSTIILRWAIVQVTDQNAPLSQAAQIVPPAVQLLPFHSFGYSASRDDDEKQDTLWTKKRVLLKGELTTTLTDIRAQEKTQNRYVRFKKPITLKYDPMDQDGFQTESSKFWFVCRSNVPHQSGTQPISYAAFAPKIHLASKVFYHE